MSDSSKESEIVHVVLLAPLPPPAGGIGRWTERYMAVAPSFDVQIHLVNEALIGNRIPMGEKSKRNLFHEAKRSFRIWRNLKRTLRELKNEKNVVVHCAIPGFIPSMMREIFSARIAKRFHRPFIIHFRSTLASSTKGKLGFFFLRKLVRLSSKTIVLNQISKDWCENHVKNSTAIVVPNFLSFSESARCYESKQPGPIKNALYVGGVTAEKGVETIIDLAKNHPDVSFRLVGNADKEMIDYASGLSNVIFTGPVASEKVFSEYEMADVFLFFTKFRAEGFSNALVEAMGAGLPCIATDWAANKEMLGAWADKLIIAVDSLEDAEKSFHELNDFDTRYSVGKYNYDRARALYSESVVVEKYKNIYFEAINN